MFKALVYCRKIGVALLFACGVAQTAHGLTVTANTVDQGYYYSYDTYVASNPSYLTGQIFTGTSTIVTHDFFAFSPLSLAAGTTIVGATLSIEEPMGGYGSVKPAETLALVGYDGDVSVLTTDGNHPRDLCRAG